jgi:hypothetical protein
MSWYILDDKREADRVIAETANEAAATVTDHGDQVEDDNAPIMANVYGEDTDTDQNRIT